MIPHLSTYLSILHENYDHVKIYLIFIYLMLYLSSFLRLEIDDEVMIIFLTFFHHHHYLSI